MSGFGTRDDEKPGSGGTARNAEGTGRWALPLRVALLFASLATLGVALWLLFVTATVLPARDPAHIPMWRWVAAAFFSYSALTWVYLVRGGAALRTAILPLSTAAIALGLYGIIKMIRIADSGGHFEGYIFLMGLVLCWHGAAALTYSAIASRRPQRIETA